MRGGNQARRRLRWLSQGSQEIGRGVMVSTHLLRHAPVPMHRSEDSDVVPDRTNAWSRPSGAFGGVSLVPILHATAELYLTVDHRDSNPRCLQISVATERLFDPVADIGCLGPRPHANLVNHFPDTSELLHSMLGRSALVLPVPTENLIRAGTGAAMR